MGASVSALLPQELQLLTPGIQGHLHRPYLLLASKKASRFSGLDSLSSIPHLAPANSILSQGALRDFHHECSLGLMVDPCQEHQMSELWCTGHVSSGTGLRSAGLTLGADQAAPFTTR